MSLPSMFSLADRRALVTGGGRGLGRHIALGLAEAGAEVWVASRKLDHCRDCVAEIEARGGRAHALAADVGRDEEVTALADAVLAEGPLHVLVNNAAMVWAAPSLDYPDEAWDRVFAVNVRGLWQLTRRVARAMGEAGGGSIIQIGSISAWLGAPDAEQPVVAYNASKGAVIALTRDLAVKLAPQGVRVNCIAPGPFLTDMMAHISHDPEKLARYESDIPLRRAGRPEDIQGVAVFLASEASAFVTGATLVVDGGVSCVYPGGPE
ncbi:MAG: SDR family NAD(P)-dependent oxidoreductase [Myxococcota bacterium]